MALKLKSFSQPDQLKRFQPGILIRLLEPHRLFFEMKGFTWPAVLAEADLDNLAGILAEPDEGMPPDLLEALHLIEHLGTDDLYDELLHLAAENGVVAGDEATAADLALLIWMKNPQALERKEREGLFQHRKSFESFRGANAEGIPANTIAPDLGPLEQALGQYFEEKKRGIGCRVTRSTSALPAGSQRCRQAKRFASSGPRALPYCDRSSHIDGIPQHIAALSDRAVRGSDRNRGTPRTTRHTVRTSWRGSRSHAT